MTNYTKATNFTNKDSLPVGDAQKKVKGAEIDDEFDAIAVAVASKANTTSPTLDGTPLAPTATAGTNTTQIATTAFVTTAVSTATSASALINALYPVGSIYINATDSTNPGTLLGHGTWAAFGTGRVLVGIDSGDTDFDTAEETGGAKTHTLTIAEMPSHSHTVTIVNGDVNGLAGIDADAATSPNTTESTSSVGGGDAHNNLQPYITVYMWKRTA